MLSPIEVVKHAVLALDEKSAREIKVLKIEEITTIANYFVICTATSTTHIKTLSDALEEALEAQGEVALRKEGFRSGGWVLVDYGCVVAHLFLEETRETYNLERLWADGTQVEISDL